MLQFYPKMFSKGHNILFRGTRSKRRGSLRSWFLLLCWSTILSGASYSDLQHPRNCWWSAVGAVDFRELDHGLYGPVSCSPPGKRSSRCEGDWVTWNSMAHSQTGVKSAPIFKFFAVENDGCLVLQEMRDVTNHARIEASSRQAMVVCLTDGSPETFWESGDEVSSV